MYIYIYIYNIGDRGLLNHFLPIGELGGKKKMLKKINFKNKIKYRRKNIGAVNKYFQVNIAIIFIH